jgi:cytochrome P450
LKYENRRNPKFSPPGTGNLPAGMFNAEPDDHTRQRRVFAHAFSNSALKAQEPLLIKYADQMVDKMGDMNERDGKINMCDLLNFTTFDIMAELCFGQPLLLLERGDYIPWVRMIFASLKFGLFRAVLSDIPVLGKLLELATASTLKKKVVEHAQFTAELLGRRLKKPDPGPDIWSFVIKRGEDETGLSVGQMQSNATAFMGAGTETTASTLSGLVYYLLTTPEVHRKLVTEIRSTFAKSSDIHIYPLTQMAYLDAVLKETLRLYPVGLGVAGRVAPPGGTDICGAYVPGGTNILMNPYCSYHNPRKWARCEEMVPERWLFKDDPEFANDQREIAEPWGVGPRACLGKKYVL